MTNPPDSPDLTPPDLTPPDLTPPSLDATTSTTLDAADDRSEPAARPGDFLVRSEERLQVRTVRARSGWARLEKYVVTETRTVEVPVSREKIRVVFFDNDGAATGVDGRAISAADVTAPSGLGDDPTASLPDHTGPDLDRWLTVSEERVLVSKETVAVERVRLQVDTVTEQRHVTEQVRTEQIEMDHQPSAHVPPSNSDGGFPTPMRRTE